MNLLLLVRLIFHKTCLKDFLRSYIRNNRLWSISTNDPLSNERHEKKDLNLFWARSILCHCARAMMNFKRTYEQNNGGLLALSTVVQHLNTN